MYNAASRLTESSWVPREAAPSLSAARTARRHRVLHLIETSIAYPYLLSFAKHGNEDRFEYIFGALGGPGELQMVAHEYGAGGLAMSMTSPRSYGLSALGLARWLRRYEVDVIQTHLFKPSVLGLFAARLAGVPSAIFTAHHVSEWEVARLGSARAAALGRFVRRRLSDHVIVPSEYIGRVLAASDRGAAGRTTVIPHGIDLERFTRARVQRGQTRAELGLDGYTVFGAVGRISPVKNYPVLIRAFAKIASADPSLVLLVVGQGSTAGLAALAHSLGVGGRVRFLGWRDDVARVMPAFDVFVHAALAETFGLALIEALAVGLPVLSSPVGIAPTLIENGVGGLLFTGTDESAIVDGLREMLRRRNHWGSMGTVGQEGVRQYSDARMVAAHEALYERLLESNR